MHIIRFLVALYIVLNINICIYAEWDPIRCARNLQSATSDNVLGLTRSEVYDKFGEPEEREIHYEVGSMLERLEYIHSVSSRYRMEKTTKIIFILRNGVVVDTSFENERNLP